MLRPDELSDAIGFVVWFTGLSASGKTTLARHTELMLRSLGYQVEVLDGEVVRRLSGSQDFSRKGRARNVLSIGKQAKELADKGYIVLCASISPYEGDRLAVRALIGAERFALVYLDSDLNTLISRDPKGLYQKALAGEIQNFTGINDPYEKPDLPDLVLPTDKLTIDECNARIDAFLTRRLRALVTENSQECELVTTV